MRCIQGHRSNYDQHGKSSHHQGFSSWQFCDSASLPAFRLIRQGLYDGRRPKPTQGWRRPEAVTADKKAGAHIDLRLNARLATWNVTSATDTGYQDALVCELARLQLSITGITEARLTGAGIRRVENALTLHSGGDSHINGVALVVLPPFVRALVSWKPISDRLLTARFAHKHGHFSVIEVAKENFYNHHH